MPVELALNGVFFGAKLGLAGLGFAIIFYTTKDLHFAYGVLLAAAGYMAFFLVETLKVPGLVGIPVVIAAAIAAGMAIQYLLYRPLPDHLAVMLISLGFTTVLENILHILFGPNDVVLHNTALAGAVSVGSLRIRYVHLLTMALFAIVWLVLYDLMQRRKTGLAIRAVMRDPPMAELVGIRTRNVKLLAYAIGSGIAALAGLITVVDTGIKPTAGFEVLMLAFMVTVVGRGSVHKVAAWSLGVGIFMNLAAWQLPTQFQTLLVFALMLGYVLLQGRFKLSSLVPRRPAAAVSRA